MSQVSERFGSTGIDNLAVWSPASSSHNRTAGPAAYWRERYRRRLLLTDILIVCAAAALPGILAATQWAGPRSSPRTGAWMARRWAPCPWPGH